MPLMQAKFIECLNNNNNNKKKNKKQKKNLSRIVTKPTKWHVRPAKTQMYA